MRIVDVTGFRIRGVRSDVASVLDVEREVITPVVAGANRRQVEQPDQNGDSPHEYASAGWLGFHRYYIDLDARSLGQAGGLHRGTRRLVRAEVPGVHLVHLRKIGHVREIDGGLHDVAQRNPRCLNTAFKLAKTCSVCSAVA